MYYSGFTPLCEMCIQLQLEYYYGLINPKSIKDMNEVNGLGAQKSECKSVSFTNDSLIILESL